MTVTLRLAPTPPPPLETGDPEFKKRVDRFAALRAARRAMAAPLGVGGQDDPEGDTIRRALDHLISQPTGDSERLVQELGGLDTVLARYARSLRASFADVSIAQLRATLPAVARDHSREVTALVELLVEDDAEVERNLSALDFLFTLLCFDEEFGRRSVARDPVSLSSRIRAACERHIDAVDETELARLELRFYGFAELEIGREDVEHQLAELREAKREMGCRLLHPRLLRAVVTYNVAVWNRLERFLETERAADPSWEERDPVPGAATAGTPDDHTSYFGHPAVGAVRAALGRRLRGEPPSDAALIERIAKRLDVSGLDESARDLLERDRGAAPPGDPDPRAAAVLLGLLLRVIPIAADELEEAGIDPRVLQFEWAREVDGALRSLGKRALGERDLEHACEISETRMQFIHEPLLLITKTIRDHYRPPKEKAKRKAGQIRGLRLGRHLAREVLRAVDVPLWGTRDALEDAPIRRAPAVLAILLCGLVGWAVLRPGAETTIREMSRAELAELSIYLESGYRDGKGEGPLFVGHVSERWETLSAAEKRREAEALVAPLYDASVSQVMVYGPRRTIEVQVVSQRIVRPPAVSADSATLATSR